MLRKIIIFSICAGSSASLPILYQSNPEAVLDYVTARFDGAPESVTLSTSQPVPGATKVASVQQHSGRRVSLEPDSRGHFIGEFKLNGRKIEALVDTGATAVAINLSTARRIGIAISRADLKSTVSTANGDTRATVVMIDRLDIGRISVEQVEAIVLEDRALSGALIGMSFLNRLKQFQVDQGSMVLVQ